MIIPLPRTDYDVLAALMERAGADHAVAVAQAALAALTGYSIRTIRRALEALARAGLLLIERRRGGGRGGTNRYRLTLPEPQAPRAAQKTGAAVLHPAPIQTYLGG